MTKDGQELDQEKAHSEGRQRRWVGKRAVTASIHPPWICPTRDRLYGIKCSMRSCAQVQDELAGSYIRPEFGQRLRGLGELDADCTIDIMHTARYGQSCNHMNGRKRLPDAVFLSKSFATFLYSCHDLKAIPEASKSSNFGWAKELGVESPMIAYHGKSSSKDDPLSGNGLRPVQNKSEGSWSYIITHRERYGDIIPPIVKYMLVTLHRIYSSSRITSWPIRS